MIDFKTLLRRTALGAGVFLVFFLLFALGFRVKAGRALAQGRAAEASGDLAQAAGAYDDAIRAHYPFSSVGRQARERLLAIAREYERGGRLADARDAYQLLLSALSAVETGFSGNRALIGELEAKVGALSERAEGTSASAAGAETSQSIR